MMGLFSKEFIYYIYIVNDIFAEQAHLFDSLRLTVRAHVTSLA